MLYTQKILRGGEPQSIQFIHDQQRKADGLQLQSDRSSIACSLQRTDQYHPRVFSNLRSRLMKLHGGCHRTLDTENHLNASPSRQKIDIASH